MPSDLSCGLAVGGALLCEWCPPGVGGRARTSVPQELGVARSREHGAVSSLLGLKSPLSLEACLVHRQLGDFQQRLCVLWGQHGPQAWGGPFRQASSVFATTIGV